MYKVKIPSAVNTIYIHPEHENPHILAAKLSTIFFKTWDFGTGFYYIQTSKKIDVPMYERHYLIIRIYKGMK
jgi:hypothetical protein